MPVTKSARKKLRKDRKRTKINRAKRAHLRNVVKTAKKTRKAKDVSIAISTIDKAAKTHLIHKNRAKRLKSALSHLVEIPLTKGKISPRLKS